MTRILDLHDKWLKDPDYAREYEALEGEFSLAAALIQAREEAGLTQADLAQRIQTTAGAIARLERGASLPSTKTLQRLAEATGTKLRITFEPGSSPRRSEARIGPRS